MVRKLGSLLSGILFLAARRSIVGAGIVLMAVVLLTAVDVTLRRAFNSPLPFSHELIKLGLIIIIWGSILYSTNRERHLSIDVIVSRLPTRTRRFFRLSFDFVSAVVLLLIGWQSITYAMDTWNVQRTSPTLNIPLHPFIFIIAAGAILAGLVLLMNFVDAIRGKGKQ